MSGYTIIAINRNTETTCVCGSLCEKISYDVANKAGDVETYGSSCIKSVLGIDTKCHELKRGVQTIKLNVERVYEKTQSYQALHKTLELVSNSDLNNLYYKVVAKWIIVDTFTTLKELSSDRKTINYNYRVSKAQLLIDQRVQDLEVGQHIFEKDLFNK